MKRLAAAAALVLMTGCLASAEPEPEADAPVEQSPLQFADQSDNILLGTIEIDGLTAEFSSRRVAEQVFSIEIVHRGITLTAEMDYAQQLFQLDGFATADGSDTVMDDDDKVIIAELGQALADKGLARTIADPDVRGVKHFTPGAALIRALSVFHLMPVSSPVHREVKAEQGHSIDYLCGYLTGYAVQATHDCWDCWSNWDGWSNVNIGPEGANNCYPDSCSSSCSNYNTNRCGKLSCEYSSGGGSNGTWQWGKNSDKYGACTAWDTNAYTRDCLHHDHCVRNDHSTGSSWCSDEAASAVDDQASANDCIMNNGCTGNCGGYSSSGQCYCDASCDTYGDCCMDKHQKCG